MNEYIFMIIMMLTSCDWSSGTSSHSATNIHDPVNSSPSYSLTAELTSCSAEVFVCTSYLTSPSVVMSLLIQYGATRCVGEEREESSAGQQLSGATLKEK